MKKLYTLIASALIALSAPAPAPAAQAQPVAQPQQAAPEAPSANQGQSSLESDYVLGAGDIVEVDVLGQSEFRTRARVKTDGTIPLPFLGFVSAQGETPTSLAQRVASALSSGGFYNAPVVSVEIVGYASRYVIVLGAVGTPGLQPVDRDYRVSEVLARAGGIRENSAEQVLLRRANGEELKLDYQKIATGTAAEDPLVAAGDKLFVPTAESYYIYGQISAPGAYALKSEMTLRKAIAQGGGLTPSGTDKRVSVYRASQKTKLDLDDAIMPGDVIVIGERFF